MAPTQSSTITDRWIHERPVQNTNATTIIACGGAACRLLRQATDRNPNPIHGVAIDTNAGDTTDASDHARRIDRLIVGRRADMIHVTGLRAEEAARRDLLPALAPLIKTLAARTSPCENPIAIWAGLGGYVGGHTAGLISHVLHEAGVRHVVRATLPFPLEALAVRRAAQWQMQRLRETADRLLLLDTAAIQAALADNLTVAGALTCADRQFLASAGFER